MYRSSQIGYDWLAREATMPRPRVSEGEVTHITLVLWERHVDWLRRQDAPWSESVRALIDEKIAAEQPPTETRRAS